MRLFWEITHRAFQRYLTYRAAALAGLATNFFFGLLRAALLVAFYGAADQVAGMSIRDAITYTGLTQGIIAYISIFGWYDLMRTIETGDIAGDLLKPLPFFVFWLANDLGRAMVAFVLRGLTIMLLYALMFELTVPTTGLQWFALFISLLLSWLVSFAWRFLVNLAAFWTPNAVGVGRLAYAIPWIFSGFLFPLRLFPAWFARLCYFTPFPALVNAPVEVYLGLLTGPELLQTLLFQLTWAVVLIAIGQVVLQAGVRRLVIQGG